MSEVDSEQGRLVSLASIVGGDEITPSAGLPMKSPGVTSLDPFRVMGHSLRLFSWLILAFLAGMAIGEVRVGYQIGLYSSRFVKVICDRNWSGVQSLLGEYLAWILGMSALLAIKQWIANRLAIVIRRSLVSDIHAKYLRDNAFYDILLHDRFVDNPDGRITNDCMEWAELLTDVIYKVTQCPVYVAWYGYRTVAEMGWLAFWICIAFGVVSMVVCRIVMSPIIHFTYRWDAANATYRLANVRVKENAEGIALNQTAALEYSVLERAVITALGFQLKLANNTILLNVFSNAFNTFGNGLVYVCIYFAASPDYSDSDLASFVSRASMVTINLLWGFTLILTVIQEFATLCGYSMRIQELWRVLEDHIPFHSRATHNDDRLAMEHVDIVRPGGEVLIRNVSFEIGPRDSLLITGPSGSGKSSIFRVLAQLWPAAGDGTICIPSSVLVLTQTPYIPPGSLYEAIAFPREVNDIEAGRIFSAINFVELVDLISRPDNEWRNGLSSGERQRIALARVIVNEPKFVLLDEATNAIPVRLEQKIFQRFIALNIAIVSISHRASLRQFHRMSMAVDGQGSYDIAEN
jgi:ABC-type uncharacterized transport system fused permease/ATPase subunit